MSDAENKEWFYIRAFNKASELKAKWFPSEPEIEPDTEVGVRQQRISLNTSFIDDLSAYWYSLSMWGKVTRAGTMGIGALAIGFLAQAPILIFSLYVLVAIIVNSVLNAHEEHRRFTSRMLVRESVELTGELDKLREEHTALNQHITLLVEKYESKVEAFNQKVNSLNETILRIEQEGKAISAALADMHDAAQESVDVEKQIIASHEQAGDMLGQLHVDLAKSSIEINKFIKTINAVTEDYVDIIEGSEHINDAPRVNANALFQPAQTTETYLSNILNYRENKNKYCEVDCEEDRIFKECSEAMNRLMTHSVC